MNRGIAFAVLVGLFAVAACSTPEPEVITVVEPVFVTVTVPTVPALAEATGTPPHPNPPPDPNPCRDALRAYENVFDGDLYDQQREYRWNLAVQACEGQP